MLRGLTENIHGVTQVSDFAKQLGQNWVQNEVKT